MKPASKKLDFVGHRTNITDSQKSEPSQRIFTSERTEDNSRPKGLKTEKESQFHTGIDFPSPQYVQFSHHDRARIFELFENYRTQHESRVPIRISNKGISRLSISKINNPLKNYKFIGNIGKGEEGSVDSYQHKGTVYAIKTYENFNDNAKKEIALFSVLASEAREHFPKLKKILIAEEQTHIVMELLEPDPGYGTYGDPHSVIVDEALQIELFDRGSHNTATRKNDPKASGATSVEIDFGKSKYDSIIVKNTLDKRARDEKIIAEKIDAGHIAEFDFTGIDCTGIDFKGAQLTTEQVKKIIESARKFNLIPNLHHANLSNLDTRLIDFNRAWLDNIQVGHIFQSARSSNFSPSLNGARLEKVDLSRFDLTDVNVTNVYFFGSELNGEKVRQIIDSANRNKTQLNFNGAVLTEGFQGAKLSFRAAKTYIDSAARMGLKLNLTGAIIKDIERFDDFCGAQLDNEQVQNRIDADFKLHRIPVFSNANLAGVDASNIRFKNARLNPEQLQQLIDTAKSSNKQPTLRGLDLRGFDLSGIDLTGVQLKGCKYDFNAVKAAGNWQKASFGIVGTIRKYASR